MLEKQKLKNLYHSGLSMKEIADRLGCPAKKIEYWMMKYQITRRSRSQATYQKRNPHGDPFLVKIPKTIEEAELKGIGLGLYWGEGTKSNQSSVRLGNTDYKLIKKFIDFLEKICSIEQKKLRFGLQIFNDIDPQKAKKFWKDKLHISDNQFMSKIVVSPPQGKGLYKKKSEYGVLTVYFHNKKLRNILVKMLG